MTSAVIEKETGSFYYAPNLQVTRTVKEKGFTQVDNTLIDSELSNKTLGVHVRLLALPPDWFLNMTDLPKRCKCSEKALRTATIELIEKGYLKKVIHRDEVTGQFLPAEYFLSELPIYLEENRKLIEQQKKEQMEDLKKGIFPKRISFCHYIKGIAKRVIKSVSYPVAQKPLVGERPEVNPPAVKDTTTNTNLTKNNYKNTSSYKDKSKVKSNKPKKNDDDFLNSELSEEEEIRKAREAFLNSSDTSKDNDSDTDEYMNEEEEPCHDLTYIEEDIESEEEIIIDTKKGFGGDVDNSDNVVDNRQIREKIRTGLEKYGFDMIEEVLNDPSLYEKALYEIEVAPLRTNVKKIAAVIYEGIYKKSWALPVEAKVVQQTNKYAKFQKLYNYFSGKSWSGLGSATVFDGDRGSDNNYNIAEFLLKKTYDHYVQPSSDNREEKRKTFNLILSDIKSLLKLEDFIEIVKKYSSMPGTHVKTIGSDQTQNWFFNLMGAV